MAAQQTSVNGSAMEASTMPAYSMLNERTALAFFLYCRFFVVDNIIDTKYSDRNNKGIIALTQSEIKH